MATHPPPIKAWIAADLYEAAREVVRTTSGLTMSKLVRMGIDGWLAQVEAEPWSCKAIGVQIAKAAGDPYPPRTDDLPTGRPMGDEAQSVGEQRVISFRVDHATRERIYNAAFWRNEYISHITRQVVETALQELAS